MTEGNEGTERRGKEMVSKDLNGGFINVVSRGIESQMKTPLGLILILRFTQN